MPQFVLIAQHAPELCPTANAKTREMMKRAATEFPELARRLGIQIVTLNVFGPDHVVLGVVEASDIEKVRAFVMQSRLSTLFQDSVWGRNGERCIGAPDRALRKRGSTSFSLPIASAWCSPPVVAIERASLHGASRRS